MINGILIDTCSFFKLDICFENFSHFKLKIDNKEYVLYFHEDLKFELENKKDEFYDKNQKFKIPHIPKDNILKLTSSQKKQYQDKYSLLEYQSFMYDFKVPPSPTDIKILAIQMLFQDNIIVLTDDKNMTTLGKFFKLKIINTAIFFNYCYISGIISKEDILNYTVKLKNANEFDRKIEIELKKLMLI